MGHGLGRVCAVFLVMAAPFLHAAGAAAQRGAGPRLQPRFAVDRAGRAALAVDRAAPAEWAALAPGVAVAGRAAPAGEGAARSGRRAPTAPLARAPTRSGGTAFLIEWGGAAGGSAAGLALGFLIADVDECDAEDIGCILGRIALGLAGGTVGAAAGGWGAGRLADTGPSLPGSALGAVAGAVAGIGLLHLLQEELDLVDDPLAAGAAFALTHGLLTAAGSRLFAALR